MIKPDVEDLPELRKGLRKRPVPRVFDGIWASEPGIGGYVFVEAQCLWDDQDRLEIPAKTEDEPRWVIIGQIEARHWSAVVTYRSDAIRIISVRRSRADEVALYESQEM